MSKKRLSLPIEPGNADVGAAVLSGDAFYRIAQAFVTHAAPDFKTAHVRATENLGELIASATNLAISIEIYLKALLLLHGQPAPKSHELPDLFAKLPSHVRVDVERAYVRLGAAGGYEGAAAFAVHVARKGAPPPDFGQAPKSQDNGLKPVLQRGANAFVTWRYLFAHGLTQPSAPLTYEFLRLGFAAKALREQFENVTVRLAY